MFAPVETVSLAEWIIDETCLCFSLHRQELMEDAARQASSLGANAIVGVSFQTNTVFEGTMDMVFYGTAVHFQKDVGM